MREFSIMQLCFVIFLTVFHPNSLQAQTSLSSDILVSDSDNLKHQSLSLLFIGDIMGHDVQIVGAYDQKMDKYDYTETFLHISDYLNHADITVGNLEVTLAGPPYTGYPQFSSPDELAIAAKAAGIDILTTANNHALDRGAKGFKRTLSMLDTLGFLSAGTYLDSVDRATRYPLIIEKNSIRIALLNYTYGTNGIVVNPPLIINRIDTAQIRRDVAKAYQAAPDYIICSIHWGLEYERIENENQKQLANYILGLGVDAIIGSHPHVIQPIRFHYSQDSLNVKPVVYSLGNFVSNQRAQYKDGGIVSELHLSKSAGQTRMDSLAYLPYWVYREDLSEKSIFYVVPVSVYEGDTTKMGFNSNAIYCIDRFAKDTRLHLRDAKESNFYKKGLHYNMKPLF